MSNLKYLIIIVPAVAFGMFLANLIPLAYRLQYCTWHHCTLDQNTTGRLFGMFLYAMIWFFVSLGLTALTIELLEEGN